MYNFDVLYNGSATADTDPSPQFDLNELFSQLEDERLTQLSLQPED